MTDEIRESLDRANAGVVPTARLESVDAAYWCRIGSKEHLRWVMPYDEEPLLDALARLRANGADGLGRGPPLIGSFPRSRAARPGLGPGTGSRGGGGGAAGARVGRTAAPTR